MSEAGAESLGTDLAQVLQTHFERLEDALRVLPPQDLWWRPHEQCLSMGMILLHLEGNLGQWILAGFGGSQDTRQRSSEFAGSPAGNSDELLQALTKTHSRAVALMKAVPDSALKEQRMIQGFQLSTQGALLHVVEHFSWHVGQAVWIAKARAGEGHGLRFYDDDQLA